MYLKRFLNLSKKILLNGGLFVLIGFFTYRMVFAKSDFRTIAKLACHGKFAFLLCGIAMLALMFCGEALTMQRNFRLLGEKQSFSRCLLYTFTGNFFSGITPAATGGQPMEIYVMHKTGTSVVKGALALLMDLAQYQLIITLLGITGYLSFAPMLHRVLGGYIWLLWLGLLLNAALLLLLLCAMFSERFIFSLVALAATILSVFSKRKAAAFRENAKASIAQYKAGAEVFRKNKGYCLVNCLLMAGRILAMHSAPFWVYKALGLSGASLFQMISLQATLHISCAALPFPGGVGISESGFLYYFQEIFPSNLLHSAMVLSRGIGGYATIALCGSILLTVFLIYAIRKKTRSKIRSEAAASN